MPIMAGIVTLEGRKYLDGGVGDSIPLRFMRKNGFDKNIVVLTQVAGYRKEPNRMMPLIGLRYEKKYPEFVRAMASRHIRYNKTLDKIQELEAAGVSEAALEVARRNAKRNNVAVTCLQADVLQMEEFKQAVPVMQDVIVSNPPYVRESEKEEMEQNVLANEPHLALFVPNEDPLLFYRQIARFGRDRLKKHGRLYFEINAAFGERTVRLLEAEGYTNVKLYQDLAGRDRMVRAQQR